MSNRRDDKYRPYLIPLLMVSATALIATISVGLYAYHQIAINLSKADAIQTELENEFARINLPRNTRALRYSATHKNGQAEVSSDYLSSFSYGELRKFYDPELSRNGWKVLKEQTQKVWGKDYGGKQTFYCKGSYVATLQYAGDAKTQLGWTYSFALSWGLFDECN